jgi:RNA polymerase sigma-70 factor (ECF subfamily)
LNVLKMTNETETIRRVLQGDTESFGLLVERYQKPVMRMIWNITGAGPMCEDLAQDVFLTAYAKLRTFDPARSRFSTWLFTITKNRCVNALKRKRPVTVGQLPERVDRCHPADHADRQELLAKLDEALEALPGKQRRSFVLAEFEGLPYDEIAQIEGTRVGTVKSRISRARQKLAETLKRYGVDEE